MYDNEDEVKRKRKILFISIGVVVVLILIILAILMSRKGGKKVDPDSEKQISCTLGVKGDAQPNSNGVYTSAIEVEFKGVTLISKDYQLTKSTIGINDNSRNKETFKITKSGKYQLHGYIQDSAGHKATCDFNVEVNLSKPTCELEVKSGTLGEDDWYKTDVEVGFKSMGTDDESVKIQKYYIEVQKTEVDTTKAYRADQPAENMATYTVTDNLVTNLVGYVIDENGTEGQCTISIKKDSNMPSCVLTVTSGTPNANGEYENPPTVGFEEARDETSQIKGKGIGLEKNYTQETYTVTDEGSVTVYGYVKDSAGNEGSCSLEVKRPTHETPQPEPSHDSAPACSISVNGTKHPIAVNDTITFVGAVEVRLTPSTTGGATVTGFGLGETQGLNGQNAITISSPGQHIIYGMTQDSYGNVGYCSGVIVVKEGAYLSKVVKVGDYVAYDAGTWTTTPAKKKEELYSWGYTQGQSRYNGVKCTSDDVIRNGWRVLAVYDGYVYIVHAGIPECVYHGQKYSGQSFAELVNEYSKRYINANYAVGSQLLNCDSPEVSGCTNKKRYASNSVVYTGSAYYLANAMSGSSATMWGVGRDGTMKGFSYDFHGIRPVIKLRAYIIATGGSGTDVDPYKIGY